MDQKLFKILKELRRIQPDSDFAEKSRFLLINSPSHQGTEAAPEYRLAFTPNLGQFFYKLKPATISISLLILIILGSIFYYSQIFAPGVGEQKIIAKANEINSSIQVKLDELKYYLSNETQINQSTLDLIRPEINQAFQNLTEASALSAETETLKDALGKIEAAQQSLDKINALLKDSSNQQ